MPLLCILHIIFVIIALRKYFYNIISTDLYKISAKTLFPSKDKRLKILEVV